MVAAPEIPTTKAPGTADMDWENLGFEYRDGEYMINAKSSPVYVVAAVVVAWFSCVVPGASAACSAHHCCYRGVGWYLVRDCPQVSSSS